MISGASSDCRLKNEVRTILLFRPHTRKKNGAQTVEVVRRIGVDAALIFVFCRGPS